MARPKLQIDEKQVFELAKINCSLPEMAAVLDCNQSTITRRFAKLIEKGRSECKMSLKRKQYEVAIGGNVVMLIWLGKQILEQKDVSRIELNQIPDDVFQKEAQRRLNLVSGNTEKIS